MLGVGIDWAETFHVVALGRPSDGVVQVLRVEHSKPALEALLEQLRALEPDPGEARVVLETRHGLLVERLVEAGFAVVPVNPDLIARRRGPAKKKDDVEDARIACLLALDRFQPLRPLIPHGELAAGLRSLGRDDERACQDERRLLNRLRADLLAVFPAAVQIAGPDMGAPTFLRMLQRWPTATALAATSRQELVAFARAAHSGYPERFADRVGRALGREHFTARQTLAQAKVDTIQLTVAQLLLIGAQRRTWERRMGQLLLGAPRRRGGALPSQAERDQGQALPGGEIYLSFPGLGDRLAARIAGEIGDHPEQFQTPNSLQCYAGQAPVTRRSGKRELLITRRLACNQPPILQPHSDRVGSGAHPLAGIVPPAKVHHGRREQEVMAMGLQHWWKTGAAPNDYEFGLAEESFEGQPVAYLRSIVQQARSFGAFCQTIAAEDYRGKRIRFSAALKANNLTDGWGGLWLRIDGPRLDETLAIDTMEDRPLVGTTGWQPHALVLDVAAAAATISFGAGLSGAGELLVSQLAFEEVGSEVPVTAGPHRPRQPQNLDFRQA